MSRPPGALNENVITENKSLHPQCVALYPHTVTLMEKVKIINVDFCKYKSTNFKKVYKYCF